MRRSWRFSWLTPAERRLMEAYPIGAWVDLRDGENDDPATGASWGPARTVRARVIASLLLGPRPLAPGLVPRVRLAGARIIGELDLSDAVIESKIYFLDCHIPRGVSLDDARTRTIRMRGCDILWLDAHRVKIDGQLDLDGSTIRAGVRLDDAHITGQLKLSYARLHPYEDLARASRKHLEGGSPDEPWRVPVAAEAPYDRGKPVAPGPIALRGDGLTADGGAFLRHLRSTGCLRLIGARFDSGLYLEGAEIRAAGTHAVQADRLTTTVAEFSDGFTAQGTVRLRGARVTGAISFRQAVLSAPDRALHLSHMQADQLILLPSSIEGDVNLGYSRIGVLFDRAECYPQRVHLNGLTYESLRGPSRLRARISLLRRDPDGYRPQPYEQLAAYYRRSGDDAKSRRVLLAKQRAHRRKLRLPGRVWGRLLDLVVGYGYRPWLAGLWTALLLAVGTAVFAHWPPHQIGLDESRHFNPFTYTLDLLVPVTVFEQRAAWEPLGWTQWLADGLIVAGWVLATALIAGGTRVLRASSGP